MVAAAVVYVKDLRQMRSFYEESFALVAAEPGGDEFCVLTSDDRDLSLVTVPLDSAATLLITASTGNRPGLVQSGERT